MSASYSFSINCTYYMDLCGCVASCDMLPPPSIPWHRRQGMPDPALTQACAHVWPRAQGRAQGRAWAWALCCLRQTSKQNASWKKQHTIYFEMYRFTCFSCFLLNFANMASPTEMTITTRSASQICTKRRAVQPLIFFLELLS